MPIFKNIYKRHIILYAFLLLPLLLNAADSPLSFTLDPIHYRLIYFDYNSLQFQNDNNENGYFIDGSLGIPLSVFSMDTPIWLDVDSIKTQSQFLYKQGDYEHRDLQIFTRTTLMKNSNITFYGKGLSYQGPYGSSQSGNILQNYRFGFEQKPNQYGFKIYTGYHVENDKNQILYSNSGSTYFGSVKYKQKFNTLYIDVLHSFQSGKLDFNDEMNYQTSWNELKLKYDHSSSLSSMVSIIEKIFERDTTTTISMRKYKFGIDYHWNKSLKTQLSMQIIGKNIYPLLEINCNTESIDFTFGNESQSWMNYKDDQIEVFSKSYLKVDYHNPIFNLQLEPRWISTEASQFYAFKYSLSINWRIIEASSEGIYYQTDDLLLNAAVNQRLKISPLIKGKGYRPFIAFFAKNIHFTGNQTISIDFNQLIDIETTINPYWAHYVDIEYGFELKQFVFKYHITQILENPPSPYPGNSDFYRHRYIEILWKFMN